MTYKTPANLSNDERDHLVSALQERGITAEKWNESIEGVNMFVEFVNDNQGFIERLIDYIRREVEKDPRSGDAMFEGDYLETIITRAASAMESPDKDLEPLGYLMNGNVLQTYTRIMTSGGDPQQSIATRSEKWVVRESRDDENPSASTITFSRVNRNVEHTITITNPDVFFPGASRGTRKHGTITIRKLLPYVLQKMIQQGCPDAVRIDLSEPVRLEMYKSEETAYRGITKFVQQMAASDISWTRKSGSKDKTIGSGGILFYHRKRKGSTVYVYVNKQFDIRELARQFTVFPDWAYALESVPFDLVRYIFFIARQNKKEIAETGKFNIGMGAVVSAIGLPTPDEVSGRRYKQLIRKPLEDAIEKIEKRVATIPEAKGKFFITPRVDDATNDIDKWLSGYIEIELRGEYVDLFSRLDDKQKHLIEDVKKASGTGKRTKKKGGE